MSSCSDGAKNIMDYIIKNPQKYIINCIKLNIKYSTKIFLALKILLLITYLLSILNYHILFLLIYSGIFSFKMSTIITVIFSLITFILVTNKKENFIKNYVKNIILLILCLVCILKFFKTKLVRQILIRFNEDNNLLILIKLLISEIIEVFIFLVKIFIFSLHIFNPFSLIRIISNKNCNLAMSLLMIIFYDSIITIIFVFNHFFIKTQYDFYKSLLELYTSKKQNFYEEIVNRILSDFLNNLKSIVVLIGVVLNSIFFWRITKIKLILMTNKPNSIILDLVISFIDGCLDILFTIIKFTNKFLFRINDKDIQTTTAKELILCLFFNKIFDLAITIVSMLQLYTFKNFLKSLKLFDSKKLNLEYLFPLLLCKKIKISEIHITCIEDTIKELNDKFAKRRNKLLNQTLTNIKINIQLMLNIFICLLNPLNIPKIYRNFHLIYTNHRLTVKEIVQIFILRQKKLMLNTFFEILIVFPILIIISLITPWNIKEIFKFILNFYFCKPRTLIIRANLKPELYRKSLNFLSTITRKAINDLYVIFKIICIHISIVRMVLFWKDIIFLLKYKNLKIKTFEKENNNLLRRFSSENFIKNSSRITAYKQNSNQSFKSDISLKSDENEAELTQFSENTLKFLSESNSDLILFRINIHFNHLYREVTFYPIIFIVSILTPWNCINSKNFQRFFKYTKFSNKYEIFKILIYLFLTDILTLLYTIFLLISLTETIDVIVLLYYSTRKNIFKQNEFKRYYSLYYKSNFKSQIKEKMKGFFSNFIILGLFLINLLLVSRIFILFKRVNFYLKSKISNDLWKFKHLKKIHSSNSHYSNKFITYKSITCISEFLTPSEIINFSSTNSYFLSVLNINTIWKNNFENYYTKKLKERDKHYILRTVNTNVFENYKSLCKEISAYLKTDKFDRRDNLIGLLQVLMEETIESFLNFPHLLLSIFKYPTRFFVEYRNKLKLLMDLFYSSNNFSFLLKFEFEHQKLDEYLNRLKLDNEFYNAQIILVISILDLAFFVVEYYINKFLIKNLNFISTSSSSINERDQRKSFFMKIVNNFSKKINNFKDEKKKALKEIVKEVYNLLAYLIYHSVLFLVPLVITNFSDLKIILLSSDNLFNSLFFIVPHLIVRTFSKSFYMILLNIVLFYLNYFYIKKMKLILDEVSDEIFYYDIIFFLLSPGGLLKLTILNYQKILFYSLFPHYSFKKATDLFYKEKAKLFITKVAVKLIIIGMYVLPFFFNFIVRLSILRIILINSYAIINILILY